MSEKTSNNARDEIQRIEEKFDAKNLHNTLTYLRMDCLPKASEHPFSAQVFVVSLYARSIMADADANGASQYPTILMGSDQ